MKSAKEDQMEVIYKEVSYKGKRKAEIWLLDI